MAGHRTRAQVANARDAMVYCSSTISLAVLETIIHLQIGDLPFDRCVVGIDVPDDVWTARLQLTPLPGAWDVIPHGAAAATLATRGLGRSAVLC